MNVEKAYKYLKQKYPSYEIIEKKDGGEVKKLIVDIEPTVNHPKWSKVVSFIFDSEPHYHRNTQEIYTVLKGTLILNVDNKKHILNEGDSFTIEPGCVHWGKGEKGEGVLVECQMKPGWMKEDHVLV